MLEGHGSQVLILDSHVQDSQVLTRSFDVPQCHEITRVIARLSQYIHWALLTVISSGRLQSELSGPLHYPDTS